MLEKGLFYEPPVKKARGEKSKREYVRPLASIPDTGWSLPTEFPDLSAASRIAIDTETRDPELKTHGPGWGRGSGEVVGVSLAVDESYSWYFPIAHENGENLSADKVLEYLRDTLGGKQPKVGANILYDIGWLAEHDVHVNGLLLDVQYAEALLDDWALSYSLEALGQKYFGEGKESNQLYDWLARSFGGAPTSDAQGSNIWRAPPVLVGPYAEVDAELPLRIIDKQWPLLEEQGLTDLFLLESRLIPLLCAMRKQGVRVDVEGAQRVMEKLQDKEDFRLGRLHRLTGRDVQIYAAEDIAVAFDNAGIEYPFTKTGKPSFTQSWLQNHNSEIAQEIVAARKLDKARSTFVEGFILNKHVNERIHCQFHPLRGDDGGAVSGRFSSSAPNLQQIPSRDPELGPLIRSLFIPEVGHVGWDKIDYSQIEYRYLAHFAVGRGADKVRELYRTDPRTDYHAATAHLVKDQTRIELPRSHTKNVNFGLCYGMGENKLCAMLGISRSEGTRLFKAYHAGVPFTKATYNTCEEQAQYEGYITTILGRRSRFTRWEKKGHGKNNKPMTRDEAMERFAPGQLQRVGTHKALNRRLQGSAADLMKKAMVDAYEAGIFDATGIPLLTVHDELDFSNPGTPEYAEGRKELIHCMETAIPCKVPIIADCDSGPDWGHVK